MYREYFYGLYWQFCSSLKIHFSDKKGFEYKIISKLVICWFRFFVKTVQPFPAGRSELSQTAKASLIVPECTFSVYGSPCNELFYWSYTVFVLLSIYSFLLGIVPELGMRNNSRCGQQIENCMNCHTPNLWNLGIKVYASSLRLKENMTSGKERLAILQKLYQQIISLEGQKSRTIWRSEGQQIAQLRSKTYSSDKLTEKQFG